MRPEDIRERDFMVGLRGYDKDEVRSFLSEIADAHGAALAEIEQLRSAPPVAAAPVVAPADDRDEFEHLGASVAAILRVAKESAAEMSADAEARAAEIRAAAETQATQTRESAERYAESMRGQADEVRSQAQGALDNARAQADAIVREANERASRISMEVEARIASRIEEAERRADALRASLSAASEELQQALVALDDHPPINVREEAQDDEPASGWAG